MVCWGNNGSGQVMVPDGSFTQVSAGYQAFVWVAVPEVRWCAGATTGPGRRRRRAGSFTQVSAGYRAFVWVAVPEVRWCAGATTGTGR